MRFKRFTFNPLSIMIGFHYGRNPVSGQRFLHVAPIPVIGLDFEFAPYLNDEMKVKQETVEKLRRRESVDVTSSRARA